MLDVLGMVSEPDEIAAARKIDQLEPRLVRYRQKKFAVGQRNEPLKRRCRIEQMFEHLQGYRDVIALFIELVIEKVSAQKPLCRPARTCLSQRIGAQVKALVAVQLDPASGQFIDDESLAAAEIKNAGGRQFAQLVSQRVVKPSET